MELNQTLPHARKRAILENGCLKFDGSLSVKRAWAQTLFLVVLQTLFVQFY